MFKIFDKINVVRIIADHVATFKDYGQTKTSSWDVFLFFVFPLIVGFILILLGVRLSANLVSLFITVFSVFAGLLFNLQILMFDIVGKASNIKSLPPSLQTSRSIHRRIDALEHVSRNISFEILLSLISVILLPVSTLFLDKISTIVFSFLVFYLVILFTLTLLMVLKRIHGLLSDEIATQRRSADNQ
jgi:F0F1-type ATP synthase assembly protein I